MLSKYSCLHHHNVLIFLVFWHFYGSNTRCIQDVYRVFKSKRYKLNCCCAGYLDPTELRLVTSFYWQSDIYEYIFDTEQHWVWISLFSCITEIKNAKKFLKIHFQKIYIWDSILFRLPFFNLKDLYAQLLHAMKQLSIFSIFKRAIVWKQKQK